MSWQIPIALIVGIDHFVAQSLAKMLAEKDISVLGIGSGKRSGNWVVVGEVDEIEENLAYIFDFEGNKKAWKRALRDGAKLVVVVVDKNIEIDKNWLEESGVNFRIVEVAEVYGEGMETDLNWIGAALESAVLNKRLVLPDKERVRPLAVEDAVEAILRSSFLSGTNGGIYKIGGTGVNLEEIKDWMQREAKMTKREIEIYDGKYLARQDSDVESNWGSLGWTPIQQWQEGLVPVMQYFFTLADEMSRKRPVEIARKEPMVMVEEKSRKYESPVLEVVEPISTEALVGKSTPTLEAIEEQKTMMDEPEVVEEESSFNEDHGRMKEELVNEYLEEVEEKESSFAEGYGRTKEPEVVRAKQKKGWGGLKLVGIAVGFLILMGFGFGGWWGLRLVLVARGVDRSFELMRKMEWSKAATEIDKQSESLRKIELDWVGLGMGQWRWGGEMGQALRLADQSMVVMKRALPIMEKVQILYGVVLKDKEADVNKIAAETEPMIKDLGSELGELQARMKGSWPFLPGGWREKIKNGVETVEKYKNLVAMAGKLIPVLPEVVGADGKKREWLILFQNEHELRPSGGFIGSFGILSFQDGKMLNLEVRDVYGADGQLKGHVEPPKPIKDYLNEAGWYMRDANWQASFPAAVKDVLWFFDKETGRKVDGVVGIDLAVARGILEVVGEVYLPDFKEKVNKDNLYEQAQFYSESKFFPGSREKENFLGSLSKQLFEELKNIPLEKQGKLIEALVDLADQNELQIVSLETKTNQVLANLGWDGAMYDGGCAKTTCVADYLYIVEANLGVNKANYFVRRSIEQLVDLSSGAVARVLKINLENTAKSTSWPGGDYKNYMRIYLPKDINISSVVVYPNNKAGERTVIEGDSLSVTNIAGKKEVGFLVTVPINSQRTVEVRYSSTISLNKENYFSYLGYIQKQPGYGNTGLVMLVTYPQGWQPLQVQPAANMVGNKLLFNQKLEQDLRVGVEIGK